MRRIAWKRGMRLTDDILRASDDNMEELIGKSIVLAATGRFGLMPSRNLFGLTLNVGNGFIDVETLSCLAVTKGGHIIDAQFDSRYNNNFVTRVMIPDTPGVEEYILTIDAQPGQWKETPDGLEEPIYTFSLIAPESVVPDNSVPIAHIVDDYGWRVDDIDFVPPCLFVSSHYKFQELLKRFAEALTEIDVKASAAFKSGAGRVIAYFWPLIQQLRITADKECDLLTPMMLLSQVQKCVSAFTCACDLDETIELTDAKMYRSYVVAPYNYKEAYQRIKVGVDICFAIAEKVEKLVDNKPKAQKAAGPKLADDSKKVDCNTSETTLSVIYNNTSATIYFTTNGSEPNKKSAKAAKSRDGYKIKFDNGFRKENGKEAAKTITIKMIAVEGDSVSETSSYDVTLQKNLKFRNAIPV